MSAPIWNGWRDDDRSRGGQWSMWKEILGTFIALLPFAILLLAWGVGVERTQAAHTVQIANLTQQRVEITQALLRIEADLKELRRDVMTRK